MMLFAHVLDLADLVEALLITAFEELTYAQHDIYLGSTHLEGHGGFGYFDLRECLRCGETCTAASDIEFRILQRFAYVLSHRRINTDSRYVRYTRELLSKGIDSVRHKLHFGNRIVGTQRRVIDLVEALFPYLDVVVLGKMFCFDVCYLGFYLLVSKWARILRE